MFDFPEIIEPQLQNNCNANCSICPYEKYAETTNIKKMNQELLTKILTDIKNNKDKIKRVIPYYNNEPFLQKGFIDILRWFKVHTPNIEIEVSTNLSAFKKDIFSKILQEELITDLRISFFGGDEDTYTKMMPGLKFKRSLKNLDEFLQLRDQYNPNQNYEIIMVLEPSLNIEKEAQSLQEHFPHKQLNFRFFGYLDRVGSNGIENSKRINTTEDVTLKGCSLNRNTERLCIDVEGDIPLCSQDWFKRVNLGNLKTSTIQDIWDSKNKQYIDSIINGEIQTPPNFICRDCKLAYIETKDGNILNFKGDAYMNQDDSKKALPKIRVKIK